MFSRKRKGKIVYYASAQLNGKQYTELVGTDKREAKRRESQIKREIAEGTFVPRRRSGSISFERYAAEWGDARENASAGDDRQRLRDHVAPYFHGKRVGDITHGDCVAWLNELRRSGRLSAKSMENVYGTARMVFEDAVNDGLLPSNPCTLSRKERARLLPKDQPNEREVYSQAEVRMLLDDLRIPDPVRVLLAIMLYTGCRKGEACGRRWKDWDPAAQPLGCLSINTKYNDEPLKTKRPRKAPVHPDLADTLKNWRERGFKLRTGRAPTPDDFIVPNIHPRCRNGHHTKSSSYKAIQRACALVGVPFKSVHAARHTMITWTRRGGAREEVLEKITHNAKGTILDHYTHWRWEPLCEAILCLDYRSDLAPAEPANEQATGLAVASGADEFHVAAHVATRGPSCFDAGSEWRRRESTMRRVGCQRF
jgi:integrase/recombinase XerD